MRHFLKISEGIDVAPINAELAAHPELWDQFSSRKVSAGTPHSGMSDIWVRYNAIDRLDRANPRTFNDEHVPVWYPAWEKLPALRSIIFDLMSEVEGEMLGGVLITRIPPGQGIDKHIDNSWHVAYFDKFYVSLQSAAGAEFSCEVDGVAETLNPKAGEIWRFDNKKLHWVKNNSDQDRVTLIVCIRTDMFKDQ